MQAGMLVIGVVGPSSAGKTTLLELLVPALRERGLWVGVVKHARHEVDPDRPGKDSARLYAAGADAVVLAAPNQLVTFVRREMPPRLADSLAGLPLGLDVVLVEGFSWERIPRYLVAPAGLDRVTTHAGPGTVLRTIVAPPAPEGSPPPFPPELIRELAAEIAAMTGKELGERPLGGSDSLP